MIPMKERGQWRSKNSEKITPTNGRLLDQAVILFFKMGTSLKGKRAVYGMENHFYHIR